MRETCSNLRDLVKRKRSCSPFLQPQSRSLMLSAEINTSCSLPSLMATRLVDPQTIYAPQPPPSTCHCFSALNSSKQLQLNHRPRQPENQVGSSQTLSFLSDRPRHDSSVPPLALQEITSYSFPSSLSTSPVALTDHPLLTYPPHTPFITVSQPATPAGIPCDHTS